MLLHTIMHNSVVQRLREKRWTDVGFLLLRLVIGIAFVYHGHMKLIDLTSATKFFASRGIPMAGFTATFVSCVEFCGGLLLILGLGTRLAGLALAVDMTVAVLTGLKRPTFAAHELELLLGVPSLLFLFAGAGAYSLDAMLVKRATHAHEDTLPMKK